MFEQVSSGTIVFFNIFLIKVIVPSFVNNISEIVFSFLLYIVLIIPFGIWEFVGLCGNKLLIDMFWLSCNVLHIVRSRQEDWRAIYIMVAKVFCSS